MTLGEDGGRPQGQVSVLPSWPLGSGAFLPVLDPPEGSSSGPRDPRDWDGPGSAAVHWKTELVRTAEASAREPATPNSNRNPRTLCLCVPKKTEMESEIRKALFLSHQTNSVAPKSPFSALDFSVSVVSAAAVPVAKGKRASNFLQTRKKFSASR